MQYPLLVKGSRGFASSHLRVADNVAEARTAFVELQVEQERSGFSEMPHLQEYVQGDVFSALTVCRHGRPVAIFMMKKLRTFPVWGGACVDAESIHDAALETVVRQLIEKLAWHGVIEIEFVRDARNGRFLLIEPSPDPNWGLDLAVASGINVPLLAWQIMQGVEPVTSQTSYRTGQRFVWFLPEGAQHVRERPGALLPMLAAALDPRVACDLRQADARPLVNWLKRTWWTLRQGA
jgi:predicted ATP-grasp superfamily ATP-dependent carboligase